MIKLNATQAAVYTALKRGIRGAKALSNEVDLDYNYISHIIRQLEKLGAVEIQGKFKSRRLTVHNLNFEVVRRPHAKHPEVGA